jgi:hypothetical protein
VKIFAYRIPGQPEYLTAAQTKAVALKKLKVTQYTLNTYRIDYNASHYEGRLAISSPHVIYIRAKPNGQWQPAPSCRN